MLVRGKSGLAICLLSSALLAGCGVPDLRSMRPQVFKPAAELVLVDGPSTWTADGAVKWAADHGVVAQAVQVPANQWLSRLQQLLARNLGVGLYLVVFNGPIPARALSLAQAHLNVRFELVGTAPAGAPPLNVREVAPSPSALGYWSGWLAGQLAGLYGERTVGWFMPSAAPPGRLAAQAVLTGLYAANPNLAVTGLAVPQPVAQAGSTGANAPGMLAGTAGYGAGIPLPNVLVAGEQPPEAWLAALQARGGWLISLVPAPGVPVAGMQVVVPGPAAVTADLTAYRDLRWSSGLAQVIAPPQSYLETSGLPATLAATFGAAAAATTVTPSIVAQLWNSLPAPVRSQWSALLPSHKNRG